MDLAIRSFLIEKLERILINVNSFTACHVPTWMCYLYYRNALRSGGKSISHKKINHFVFYCFSDSPLISKQERLPPVSGLCLPLFSPDLSCISTWWWYVYKISATIIKKKLKSIVPIIPVGPECESANGSANSFLACPQHCRSGHLPILSSCPCLFPLLSDRITTDNTPYIAVLLL